ncbi:hypothetical protein pipiens_016136 [Culex pipiens pipiens]|uniref:SERPIN domain-containing protein n=1 Tax=Culex pipiens pipiens TaxID=38569 RepID=A0ABD1CML0_CULPP
MVVKQALFITFLSFYLGNSQQILEKKKVVVDIDKSLTKYLLKFYKHRLVEGQNNAISPLLDLYGLALLYKVSDASAKTDLHTLLGIPEDAEDGTMDKFEAKIRLYLEQIGGSSVLGTQLFIDSRIKGITKELQDVKFFTTSSIAFSQKAEFQQKINSWMTRLGVPNKHHFVHNFNFDDKTVSLILQNNFHVLSSMFSSPSIRLELDKEDKHPIKGFLMHCMFQFVEDNSAKVAQQATLAVNFEKPFTVMALTKDTNIPLLMANYFSVRDKMLAMEDEEQSLAEQVAKEELGNREDL